MLTMDAMGCAAATLTAPAGKKARGWRTGRVRDDTDAAEVLTAAGLANDCNRRGGQVMGITDCCGHQFDRLSSRCAVDRMQEMEFDVANDRQPPRGDADAEPAEKEKVEHTVVVAPIISTVRCQIVFHLRL